MRSFLAAITVGGAALLGAGTAVAQETKDDGIDCVYNALAAHYDLVAEVFLYDDMSQEDITKVDTLVETAKKDCATRYKFSEGQLFTIGELGVYVSSIDYLSEELLWSGATEASLDGVLDVFQGLSDEDVDMLFDTTWRSNVAFHDKLKSAVVAKGIPSDEDSVMLALTILEISALADEAVTLFDLDDLLTEDDSPQQ
jgi:hypothetical protein